MLCAARIPLPGDDGACKLREVLLAIRSATETAYRQGTSRNVFPPTLKSPRKETRNMNQNPRTASLLERECQQSDRM